jgi:hypothetical protein
MKLVRVSAVKNAGHIRADLLQSLAQLPTRRNRPAPVQNIEVKLLLLGQSTRLRHRGGSLYLVVFLGEQQLEHLGCIVMIIHTKNTACGHRGYSSLTGSDSDSGIGNKATVSRCLRIIFDSGTGGKLKL